MIKWITDRLPTEADADEFGLVKVPSKTVEGHYGFDNKYFSLVALGQPWWSPKVPVPRQPNEATKIQQPRKIDKIAICPLQDNEYILIATADDGTLWELDYRRPDKWAPLPPLPQYEVSNA